MDMGTGRRHGGQEALLEGNLEDDIGGHGDRGLT